MTTVVYHSADFDGIFCREIASKFLETDIKLIGWNFGEARIPIPPDGPIFILDLPPECLEEFGPAHEVTQRIIWIDHHKTSIEQWGDALKGYRIDGVSACRLAWQWFTRGPTLPVKQDYLDRSVKEPVAVMLAGEYDIWDHRGDGDLELQFGLRSEDPDWNLLLSQDDAAKGYVHHLIDNGRMLMRYQAHVDGGMVKKGAFLMVWEGRRFLCLNNARFNSNTFAELDKPETGHAALLGFYWNGKVWTVSLYHAAHKKDIDLSMIAKKYGGGGHRGACGFTCPTIPFPLFAQ